MQDETTILSDKTNNNIEYIVSNSIHMASSRVLTKVFSLSYPVLSSFVQITERQAL